MSLAAVGPAPQAAEVRVNATGACATREELVDEVDGLLGRPVAQVEGLDFEVEIHQVVSKRWALQLTSTSRPDGARRSREITGATCSEMAEAAAVAIAMSVRELAAPPSAGDKGDAVAAKRDGSSVLPAHPPDRPAAVPEPPSSPAARPRRMAVGVDALADAATLPGLGGGLGVGAAFGWSRLLLLVEAELFPAREKVLPDGSGGSFRLVAATGLACFATPTHAADLLLCAGAEAGLMQAEGTGVGNPRLRSVAWEAARVEVGGARRVTEEISLFLRGGVALPWSRPTFRLNDTVEVFQPGSVAARLTLGAYFSFF